MTDQDRLALAYIAGRLTGFSRNDALHERVRARLVVIVRRLLEMADYADLYDEIEG